MTESEKYQAMVLKTARGCKQFCKDVDGFYYWWPGSLDGICYNAESLRIIADELDRMNKDWERVINTELK